MTKLCLLLTMLVLPALGGCQFYAQEVEVRSRFGTPDLVKYVSGEQTKTVLYGQPKPDDMGKLDQQVWYYLDHNAAIAFHDDTYSEPHPMSTIENIIHRREFAALRRKEEPAKDVNLDAERPADKTIDPKTIQQPQNQ